MIKEKWVRISLIGLLAILIAIGGYALHLRNNKRIYDESIAIYREQFHTRLLVVKDKILALPDADDAEYWADVPENVHFQSILSEARAILQVMANLAYQPAIYEIYEPITQFQSAINYFTDQYILYYYEYNPDELAVRLSRLKNGIRNFV